jgi:hypothetical protein
MVELLSTWKTIVDISNRNVLQRDSDGGCVRLMNKNRELDV